MTSVFSETAPLIFNYAEQIEKDFVIDKELYESHNVNIGLRDINGNGVLTGLTEISEIVSYIQDGDQTIRCDGQLYYRGINVKDIVQGTINDHRFGFEETAYLLLFGKLPTKDQLQEFENLLSVYRNLPTSFVRDIILKAPSKDMMNTLARSVLTLFSYDDYASNTSIPNVLRQCLQLIALFPLLAVYGYQAYRHYEHGDSLFIHQPDSNLSTAENILMTLRPDKKYSELEALILDLALIVHAEHGGGNNSTFTCRVVTSSGTDTYSAIAAALGSLKGPKHGGANIKVVEMFEDIKTHVKDWEDEDEITAYLNKLLVGEAFDKQKLIYGMGHAIYSVSDPRATILKNFVERLANEKNMSKEYQLYEKIERLAPEAITKKRRMYKGVSANVDFYSGFVYHMLGLPRELYTPIFAIARMSGWSAHRLEELINVGKIIRPAYLNVSKRNDYKPLSER